MMHFSCDLCGKDLLPGQDQRYEVKIEVRAAGEPTDLTEEDLMEDHLEAVSQILREGDEDLDLPALSTCRRFDLCTECHNRYVRDPLGKENGHKLHFSNN